MKKSTATSIITINTHLPRMYDVKLRCLHAEGRLLAAAAVLAVVGFGAEVMERTR